jgi:hypothetical protein
MGIPKNTFLNPWRIFQAQKVTVNRPQFPLGATGSKVRIARYPPATRKAGGFLQPWQSMSDSAIMRQLRRNISTASLFASPLAEENHLTTYGASALAISIHMGLVQSSLGSAAARAKVQRRRRSKSTSARSARRLIILIGSA